MNVKCTCMCFFVPNHCILLKYILPLKLLNILYESYFIHLRHITESSAVIVTTCFLSPVNVRHIVPLNILQRRSYIVVLFVGRI